MKESAQTRYLSLSADRTAFLDEARDCAKVTLPYLLTDDGLSKGGAPADPLAISWIQRLQRVEFKINELPFSN